jgi:hypothetical protein
VYPVPPDIQEVWPVFILQLGDDSGHSLQRIIVEQVLQQFDFFSFEKK